MEVFMQNQRDEANSFREYEEYNDILYYSDF